MNVFDPTKVLDLSQDFSMHTPGVRRLRRP